MLQRCITTASTSCALPGTDQVPIALPGTDPIPIALPGTDHDFIVLENIAIKDLNDLYRGGNGGYTFTGLSIAPLKINVVQTLKDTRNMGMIAVLNLFMLSSIIAILHDVMPKLEMIITHFLDGKDFIQWTNELIIAAGQLTTAKKAQDKNPEGFKKAQDNYQSFQTIFTRIRLICTERVLSSLEMLETLLDAVMKPEGLASCLDYNNMNIYIACARVIIGVSGTIASIPYGTCVFVPFGDINNWIIASLSMILPGTKIKFEDINAMMQKYPAVFATMKLWFLDIPQGDDIRLSAYCNGILSLVDGCLNLGITKVLVAALTHAGLAGAPYHKAIHTTVEVCNNLSCYDIEASITRPLAEIASKA
jgi:hypothetical protein